VLPKKPVPIFLPAAVLSLLAISLPAVAASVPDTAAGSVRADTTVAAGGQVPESQTAATQADVLGVQSDLENYKFQVQRDRDLKTAQSTRSLLVSGIVQGRGGWTEARAAQGYRKHTAGEVATALVGFSGNLYRDYEQGKNLSYACASWQLRREGRPR
jgi:hypothetical protein